MKWPDHAAVVDVRGVVEEGVPLVNLGPDPLKIQAGQEAAVIERVHPLRLYRVGQGSDIGDDDAHVLGLGGRGQDEGDAEDRKSVV